MQYGFVIDHHKCIGCHACTVACKSENDVPLGSFRTWVKYTETGTFPEVRRHFAVLRCNHCTSAPCVTICPVNALEKRADGIVDLDRDACIGCKACMQACPYDALYLDEDTGAAEKCHYCAHRVEQGLEPACVVVCPERAIVPGDLHDPRSEIAALARREEATVRRPEQGTGPNVFYLGAEAVSLEPGRAAEPDTWIWAERRLPPPEIGDGHEPSPQARVVLDADHDLHWGAKVSGYLVTKGVAAGAAMLAPFAPALGVDGSAATVAPELLALVFTALTTGLLVWDLKRPARFLAILLRPNPESWLVRGAWVLTAFGGLTTAILALRLAGGEGIAETLRLPNALLGAATAGYTAFLFAQCEGRDLWQNPRVLLPHLLVQAVLLGGVAWLVFAPTAPLAILVALAALLHGAFALRERFGPHDTDNARMGASAMGHVRAWRGAPWWAFREGVQVTTAVAVVLAALVAMDLLDWPLAAIAAVATAVGVFLYEQAYVRGGQTPPLS